MKTMRIAGAAAALAVLAASGVQAQVEFELTPFAGGTVFLADPPNQFALGRRHGAPDLVVGNGSFDDAWTLGMNAGIRINDRWAVEGLFSWIPTSLRGNGIVGRADVNGFMYGVTGIHYFAVDWPVTPFLGLGIGAETFDYESEGLETETEFMGNVVGGLFLPLTEGVGMRFEARDCFARFDSGVASIKDTWENDLMLTVGFSFRTPIG